MKKADQTIWQAPNRKQYRYFCAAFLLLLFFSPSKAANTGEKAKRIIDRMSVATRTLNYDGIFVLSRGNHLVSMRIIHKVDDGREFERLLSLTGAAREVIRDNQKITWIFSDNRAVMVAKKPPRQLLSPALPEPIEKIADSYSFAVLGSDRVAGRGAWVVGIRPKHQDRYGYRLWIDTKSYLLLKSKVIDLDGEALEQMLFTDMKMPEHIPASLLRPAITGEGYTWYTNEPGPTPRSGGETSTWKAEWLPKGFVMRDHRVQAMSATRMPVDHMVFSDGLATVSIFVEKFQRADDLQEGDTSLGTVNAYSTMVSDYLVTVVGELPSVTIRQIAASVRPPCSGS